MKQIQSLDVRFGSRLVGRVALSPDRRLCSFEYDADWISDGFSISPLELPLKPGLMIAKPHPFRGNFGVFEDSLPDGYGRYLLDKTLGREGINITDLTVLQLLSIVGAGGMGALIYHPSTKVLSREEINDFDLLQAKALEVLREKQDSDAGLLLYNSGNSGGARPKAVFTDSDGHWLVKFRHIYDAQGIGVEEMRCNELARRCGITVPDFKLINNKYFATRRFDITPGNERIHVATAGGLLGVSLSTPILDYHNLLALTGYMTQCRDDVEQMFRRMVFNYMIDNKDDHCKNFSFMVVRDESGKWSWRLAPAYDLTVSKEGYNGQHATSVNGIGNPTIGDFVAVGLKNKISRQRCQQIIEELQAVISQDR